MVFVCSFACFGCQVRLFWLLVVWFSGSFVCFVGLVCLVVVVCFAWVALCLGWPCLVCLFVGFVVVFAGSFVCFLFVWFVWLLLSALVLLCVWVGLFVASLACFLSAAFGSCYRHVRWYQD